MIRGHSGVVHGHWNFVGKRSAEEFDGPSGGVIVRIASEDEALGNGAGKRSERTAGGKGVTVAPVSCGNFKANVPGAL